MLEFQGMAHHTQLNSNFLNWSFFLEWWWSPSVSRSSSGKEQGCDLAIDWRCAPSYSQSEGDVLTLSHCAIQRNHEGLVELGVTLGPRKVNLDLVMEHCRGGEKIGTKAGMSIFMETSSSPNNLAVQTHRTNVFQGPKQEVHTLDYPSG